MGWHFYDSSGREKTLQGGTAIGMEYVYAERTSNLVLTTSFQDVVSAGALTFNGSDVVLIEFFSDDVNANGTESLSIMLYDDATELGYLAAVVESGGNARPVYAARRLTPTAGSHTYKVRAKSTAATSSYVAGGSGGVGANIPCFIRITRAA